MTFPVRCTLGATDVPWFIPEEQREAWLALPAKEKQRRIATQAAMLTSYGEQIIAAMQKGGRAQKWAKKQAKRIQERVMREAINTAIVQIVVHLVLSATVIGSIISVGLSAYQSYKMEKIKKKIKQETKEAVRYLTEYQEQRQADLYKALSKAYQRAYPAAIRLALSTEPVPEDAVEEFREKMKEAARPVSTRGLSGWASGFKKVINKAKQAGKGIARGAKKVFRSSSGYDQTKNVTDSVNERIKQIVPEGIYEGLEQFVNPAEHASGFVDRMTGEEVYQAASAEIKKLREGLKKRIDASYEPLLAAIRSEEFDAIMARMVASYIRSMPEFQIVLQEYIPPPSDYEKAVQDPESPAYDPAIAALFAKYQIPLIIGAAALFGVALLWRARK